MPSPKEGWHSGSAIWMKAKFNQMPGVVHVSEGFENGHAGPAGANQQKVTVSTIS